MLRPTPGQDQYHTHRNRTTLDHPNRPGTGGVGLARWVRDARVLVKTPVSRKRRQPFWLDQPWRNRPPQRRTWNKRGNDIQTGRTSDKPARTLGISIPRAVPAQH